MSTTEVNSVDLKVNYLVLLLCIEKQKSPESVLKKVRKADRVNSITQDYPDGKVCSRCGERKSTGEFNGKRDKDKCYLSSMCKECIKKYNREYYSRKKTENIAIDH